MSIRLVSRDDSLDPPQHSTPFRLPSVCIRPNSAGISASDNFQDRLKIPAGRFAKSSPTFVAGSENSGLNHSTLCPPRQILNGHPPIPLAPIQMERGTIVPDAYGLFFHPSVATKLWGFSLF